MDGDVSKSIVIKNHVSMQKVVEHFQSNWSVCRWASHTLHVMVAGPQHTKIMEQVKGIKSCIANSQNYAQHTKTMSFK